MSQFRLETELNALTKLDAPITKGPAPRWQRKASSNRPQTSPLRNSSRLNTSSKTPSKTPKSGGKTPRNPKTPKTPSEDRFIASRSSMNFEANYYKLVSREPQDEENDQVSPSKQEFQKNMADNLNGNEMNARILAYKTKAPTPREGYMNDLRVLYSQSKSSTVKSSKKNYRHVPQVPERILDAPDLIDDYYLNLLDWSCNNHLAVALSGFVYLWNAGSGDIVQLCKMDSPDTYVGSVSWIKEGNYLAIGTSEGVVQLWDVENQKRIRNMAGHPARVGALSWNSYILSSGCRSGKIHHHDVRAPEHHVATLDNHTQEVCGLKWSPDGKFLASGGNDNLLNIWDASISTSGVSSSSLFCLSQHQAAVKALDWCPFQRNVLASGGGTADRHIKFWNASTGVCLNSIDTKSQVCSILWSAEHKELISSHGYAQNQLVIWKYPSMTRTTELTGHSCRVLHMAMSPDGQTVVSAAADETLRLWKCFATDPMKKKSKPTSSSSSAIIRQGIR